MPIRSGTLQSSGRTSPRILATPSTSLARRRLSLFFCFRRPTRRLFAGKLIELTPPSSSAFFTRSITNALCSKKPSLPKIRWPISNTKLPQFFAAFLSLYAAPTTDRQQLDTQGQVARLVPAIEGHDRTTIQRGVRIGGHVPILVLRDVRRQWLPLVLASNNPKNAARPTLPYPKSSAHRLFSEWSIQSVGPQNRLLRSSRRYVNPRLVPRQPLNFFCTLVANLRVIPQRAGTRKRVVLLLTTLTPRFGLVMQSPSLCPTQSCRDCYRRR